MLTPSPLTGFGGWNMLSGQVWTRRPPLNLGRGHTVYRKKWDTRHSAGQTAEDQGMALKENCHQVAGQVAALSPPLPLLHSFPTPPPNITPPLTAPLPAGPHLPFNKLPPTSLVREKGPSFAFALCPGLVMTPALLSKPSSPAYLPVFPMGLNFLKGRPCHRT